MMHKLTNTRFELFKGEYGREYAKLVTNTENILGNPVTLAINQMCLNKVNFNLIDQYNPFGYSIGKSSKLEITFNAEPDTDGISYTIEPRPIMMTVEELRKFAEEKLNTEVILLQKIGG